MLEITHQLPYQTLDQNLDHYNIYIAEEPPAWIEKFKEANSDEGAIPVHAGIKYLHTEEQYYLEDQQVTLFKKTIKQPVTMNGVEECSKIFLEFNPRNKLYIHKILVYRETQWLDKRSSAETHVLRREYQAERNILSGDLTLSIVLNDIKVNDIIVVSFSLIYSHEFQVKFFNKIISLEYAVSVHRLCLTVRADTKRLAYQFLDKACDIQCKSDQEKQILIIDRTDVPAREMKQYEPYWYWKISYLQVGVNKSWTDIAVSYLQYFRCPAISEPQLLKLIDELKQDAAEQEKIVLKIFNFIQNNIRYFSNYDPLDFIKPNDPNTTMKRAYGDCKDLVFLFRAILDSLNILSYPVLVNSVHGKNINNLLPSAFIFDHAVILVKIDETEYFIDPTLRQDVDSLKHIFLPNFGYGLVCTEKTDALRKIENSAGCKSTLTVSEQYQILSWEENDILFRSNLTITGLLALKIMQNCFDPSSKEQFLESFKNSYQSTMVVNKVIKNQVFPLKNNQIKIEVEYHISLKYCVRKKTKFLAFEVTPTEILENALFNFPLELEEGSAFYYGPLADVNYDVEFFNIEIRDKNTQKLIIEDGAFLFSKENLSRAGRNRFKYTFKKIKEAVVPHDYASFLGHCDALKKILPILIFRRKKPFLRFFDISPSRAYIGMVIVSIMISAVKNLSTTTRPSTGTPAPTYKGATTLSCDALSCRDLTRNPWEDKDTKANKKSSDRSIKSSSD